MEIDAEIIVRRPQCRIARFAEPDDGRGRKVVLANTERVLRGLPAPAVGYRGVDLARGFKVHPTTVS